MSEEEPDESESFEDQVETEPINEFDADLTDGNEPVDFAKFGAAIYSALGLGVFITLFLTITLVDEDAVLAELAAFVEDDELFFAAALTFEYFVLFAPLTAVAIAAYYYHADLNVGNVYTPGTVAAAVGTLVVMLILLILMVIFEPDMADISIGDEIPGILGTVIGAAITGALTTAVLDNI